MSVTGEPDGPPTKVGVALVDVIAGLFATVGILAALRERERSGLGQRVDVSLFAALLAGARQPASRRTSAPASCPSGWATAIRASRRTSRSRPPTARSSSRSATIASSPRCAPSSGAAELAADARFATNPTRVANRDELLAALAPRFAVRTRAELASGARRRRRAVRPGQRRRRRVRARRAPRPALDRRDGRRRAPGRRPDRARRDAGRATAARRRRSDADDCGAAGVAAAGGADAIRD